MQQTMRCPFCAEAILAAAKKCKHCGEFIGRTSHISGTSKAANNRIISLLWKSGDLAKAGQTLRTQRKGTLEEIAASRKARRMRREQWKEKWRSRGAVGRFLMLLPTLIVSTIVIAAFASAIRRNSYEHSPEYASAHGWASVSEMEDAHRKHFFNPKDYANAKLAGFDDKTAYDKHLEEVATDVAQKRKEESQRYAEQAANNEAELENPKEKALNEAFGFLGPNKLEKATFIFGASKKDWQEFTDGGGLNNENFWQELLIENVELRFDRTNMVKEVSFVTPTSLTSPKDIRSKIDVICGFAEAEWSKTNDNYISGSAKNGRCSAIYLPQNDELTNFEITRLH